MNPVLIALVLCAAMLHASWNALLKGGSDRFQSMVVMNVAAGVACIPAAFFLPFPRQECWWAIVLSAAFHVAYNLSLVRAYEHGDLGQVYPIARGSSPLLVTLGAAIFAGERPSSLTLTGIALVSVGIFSLARAWTKGASASGVRAALATGILIAAYTVTDGLGGRLSQDPPAYAAWLFILDGAPMLIIYWWARGGHLPFFEESRWETMKSAAGGMVSLVAYTVVIWAASIGPMGTVSALRETSVVFAAILGRVFLSERLSVGRFASCATVALGAIILGQQP